MAHEQQSLVSVLYSVHNKLRAAKRQSKDEDEWTRAWEAHTSDMSVLQEYSKAMHDLATKVWDPRNKNMTPRTNTSTVETLNTKNVKTETVRLKCRLEWVVQRCVEYFHVQLEPESGNCPINAVRDKLKLLDVGSCYNPFSEYSSIFDITAVDLCPAPGHEKDIFQCDFTALNLVEEGSNDIPNNLEYVEFHESEKFKKLTGLQRNSFDCVVFSYFLEYLADTRQRLLCCEKAFELLKPNGLLFILRPDSNRVTPGGNNRLIKKLKIGMAMLGFKRIYFEKLEHLWCMGFKKLDELEKNAYIASPYFQKDVQKGNCAFAFGDNSRLHELFFISQDLREVELEVFNQCEGTMACDQALLKELPGFDSNMFDG